MAQSLHGYAHLPQWVMCSRTSFYARQWYDVTNDVICASLTVEDRLLIEALHIERVGDVDRMIAEFSARQWKQRTFLRTKEHINN